MFAAIVAKAPMRSGGDYSVGRFVGIEAECANRIPLCPTDDVGYAELSLTKVIQRGIHRNSLLRSACVFSHKARRAPLSRSVDPAHAVAMLFSRGRRGGVRCMQQLRAPQDIFAVPRPWSV